MTKRFLTLALAVMATTAAFAQTQAAKPDAAKSKTLTMLQGTWVFTSMNGQDASGGPEVLVTITDNKYVQTVGGEVVEKGTFKIDETKKPMAIDLTILEGDSAGKSQVGICEVTDTTMKAKLADAGGTTRPTNMEQEDGFFIIVASKKK
jgi:uncharacterized protein (TIGR03067 family)